MVHFKNYGQAEFEFSRRIIGIYGPNGIGKTNLLDAIHYLCFTKSYFTRSDARNVKEGSVGFRIQGNFIKSHESVALSCIMRETGKKEVLWNGELYDKFSRHIGRIPCVVIAPDDVFIITSTSDERRRFLDTLLSQLDPEYLSGLIEYNRVLQQRNGYLRGLNSPVADDQLLDVYDKQLADHGMVIYAKRAAFLQPFIKKVSDLYLKIAGKQEAIDIIYRSQASEGALYQQLKAGRRKDLITQRSNIGIHKDDLEILLESRLFKSHASQGQRKSLLFSLKLAEFEFLKENKGFAPILLLDDVFEKLDESRMKNLLHCVCTENDGQIFITDTHPGRIEEHIRPLGIELQNLELMP